MKLLKVSFLICCFVNSLYSQYEIGINYNISTIIKNRFINSLNYTYFYYYQFNTLHIIQKNNSKNIDDFEVYMQFDHVFEDHFFFRVGMGDYQFITINTLYLTDINQYKVKWFGDYNGLFVDWGRKYILKKQFGFEYYLGLGYIFQYRLFYKKWEVDSSPYKEPFEYVSGNFSSYEGLMFRLGGNVLFSQRNINIRLGMLYQYTITGVLFPQKEDVNLYWLDQSKIWITNNISRYIIEKEQYELENKTIFNVFPKIENVKVYFSNLKIFLSIGFRF